MVNVVPEPSGSGGASTPVSVGVASVVVDVDEALVVVPCWNPGRVPTLVAAQRASTTTTAPLINQMTGTRRFCTLLRRILGGAS